MFVLAIKSATFERAGVSPHSYTGLHPTITLSLYFSLCPRRATCRFNGYNEKYKDKLIVGCNPVYECGLTPALSKVADLMANTNMDYSEIAEAIGRSKHAAEWSGKQVLAVLGVKNRIELIQKFKGKRLS